MSQVPRNEHPEHCGGVPLLQGTYGRTWSSTPGRPCDSNTYKATYYFLYKIAYYTAGRRQATIGQAINIFDQSLFLYQSKLLMIFGSSGLDRERLAEKSIAQGHTSHPILFSCAYVIWLGLIGQISYCKLYTSIVGGYSHI